MLTVSQERAVCHGEGPCLVLAGPGSGKTFVLTKRICTLIQQKHVSPERILVLTFTKAAAKEMKERFDSMMEQSAPVVFGTNHSVFYQMIKRDRRYQNYILLTGKTKQELLREVAADCGVVIDQADELEELAREMSLIKNRQILPQNMVAESNFQEKIVSLYQGYESRKQQAEWMDFDDILSITLSLLRDDPHFKKRWQNQFSYFLVDEVQDMNMLQYQVLQHMAHPENNLFMVGDEDQSIYGFRGATPQIMHNVWEDYPQCTKIVLEENFRCAGEIIQAANSLISHNDKRFKKRMIVATQMQGEVICQGFCDRSEQIKKVCAILHEYKIKTGEYGNVAILFRNRVGYMEVVDGLRQEKIPFQTQEDLPNIYRHWVILDLISYLRMTQKTLQRADIFRIMNRPNRFLSRGSVKKAEICFEDWKQYYKKQPWLYERIEQLERDVHFLRKLSGVSALNYIRKKIGYDNYLKEKASNEEEWKQWMEAADSFLALAQGTKNITQLLERWDKEQDFLEKAKKKQTDFDVKGGVALHTLHGAKGLEFERVFILDCNEGIIPSGRADTEEKIQEERRLFYVGITRAKEKVYLFYQNQEQKNSPSRFLSEWQKAVDRT